MVGFAPDTFFSAGQQTSREIIESGRLGQIKSGTACMLSPGPESWHPNPGFYYLKGAGPVFDMAPYYLTALINFLGPIKSVSAITSKSSSERVATCNERHSEKLPVEVNTHASGTLLFHSGAVISAVFSFDMVAASHSPIELYGTKGSIKVPDPNSFGGPVCSFVLGEDAWIEHELTRVYAENIRGIGVADMVQAILENRQHRATGALAFHVLEVMHAFDKSSDSGLTIEIKSQPERPAALSANSLD
ncbi:MAG: Gfo/Idh/MocA family oxidoreductase [Verrucomicrobiota bacterium]|nr:Gfo/Idh/MocA family oxidoreductase [Verrucomicrobiota bacterium]